MGSRLNFISLFLISTFLMACQAETGEDAEVVSALTASEPQTTAAIETEEEAQRRLLATFPAQQRAPEDPEQVAQGELIYGISCRACHGVDMRGGDLGGPNLLRSQLVLNDQEGELIMPVLKDGRNNPGMTVMPPQGLSDDDMAAVSAYVHSIVATSERQGAPPRGQQIELNIVVGDPEAGQQYFQAECTGCHSAEGDLQGIASQLTEPMAIQDAWVSGRRRGPPNPNADSNLTTTVMVTVSLSDGENVTGELGRIDDFLVSLTTPEGEYRSFTLHENTNPSVVSIEKRDPMQRHKELLSELTDDMMHNVTAYLVNLK